MFYSHGGEVILSGSVDFANDVIKLALVTDSYKPNLSTDRTYTAISEHVLGTPQQLTGVSINGGVFAAAKLLQPGVAAGNTIAYLVLFKDTGNPDESPLIKLFGGDNGLHALTDGADVTIQWKEGVVFSVRTSEQPANLEQTQTISVGAER